MDDDLPDSNDDAGGLMDWCLFGSDDRRPETAAERERRERAAEDMTRAIVDFLISGVGRALLMIAMLALVYNAGWWVTHFDNGCDRPSQMPATQMANAVFCR